jgi:two-component system chemotaxis response regulator CheB
MPINVFLVDDSATVRAVLKMLLEKDPDICVIGVAATADIALKKMSKQWPDVIVSDLEMPGMHGLEFLKYIREHRPTPFVVCSSHVGPGAKASLDALALGAR